MSLVKHREGAMSLPARRSPRSRQSRVGARRPVGNRFAGLIFALPALAVFGVFLGYPVYETVRLSFYDWDGLDPLQLWVGLANYRELFDLDPFFMTAVKNTALWAIVTVPLQLGAGLGLALLLDRKLRGRVALRAIFFLPAILSPVVIAISWSSIYAPGTGAINELLGALGLGRHHAWLGEPDHALWAAMAVSLWRYAGLIMIFYLAALQLIPSSLYEAAEVDGASTWAQIRSITIPQLRPMTWLLVVLGTIGALREFDVVYVLTGGGPAHSSDLLSIQVFQQGFQLSRPGYASAIATLMLVVTIVIAVVQLGILARAQRSVS
jgi:raffinose/stachyose/melibiose transport system permease protein